MNYEEGRLPAFDVGAGARDDDYRPHPYPFQHPHQRIEKRQKDNGRERPIAKRRVELRNNDDPNRIKIKARKQDQGGKFQKIQVKRNKGSTSPGRTREIARLEYLYGANNMSRDSRDDEQSLRRKPQQISPLHQCS